MPSNEKFSIYLCGLVEQLKYNKDNAATFEEFLNKGADINFKSPYDNGNTPLHFAIKNQNLDWVRLLVKTGASSIVTNDNGISAKDAAAKTGNQKLIKALKRFKKINDINLIVVDITETDRDEFLDNVTDVHKILKIKNCVSLDKVLFFLSQKTFLNRIINSQLFVLIFEIGDCEEDNNIANILTISFKDLKIVQIISKKINSLYFNDTRQGYKKITIGNLDRQMLDVKKFDFESLCSLLNSSNGFYGKFHNDLMEIEIDMYRKIKNFSLVNLAVAESDLLCLKFLSLFDLKFSCEVNNNIVMNAIQYGNLEDLKLCLGFPQINSFLENKFLMCAVQWSKNEIVKFLLENNCNVKAVDDSIYSAADCALKNRNYDVLLDLLLADSPFPENFQLSHIQRFQNRSIFEELMTSIEMFHENIRENRIKEIRKFMDEYPKMKHVYTSNNQCALTTALTAKRFDIYSFLRSEGFSEGIDGKCRETLKILKISEREEIKIENRKYFECSDSKHLQKLIARSFLGFGSCQENFNRIKKYFIALNKIPEVQPILKVVSKASKLKIVFDFNRNSVCDMDPTQIYDHTLVYGRTIYPAGNILIGAKLTKNRTKEHLLSTLAHELTHLAVHILYNNLGKPYRKDDVDQMEKFKNIVDATNHFRNDSDIITNAFCYEGDEIHSELIVRVPQICTFHKNQPKKLRELRNTFQDLFQYFHDKTLKDCNAMFPKIKSQQKIESLNKQLSVYSKFAKFGWYSNKYESSEDEILKKSSNLFIRTNYPELLFSSIIRKLDGSSSRTRLFVELEQLLDEKYVGMILEAFQSEQKPKMFVAYLKDQDFFDIEKALMELDLTSRVVFISAVVPESFGIFGEKLILNYNFNDLCDESKTKFMAEKIDFQGKSISLGEIISNNDFLSELPIKEVLNIENWKIRQNFINRDFYIDRKFSKAGKNKEAHILTTEDVCHQIMLRKAVVLADDAGKGKTCAAIEIALKLTEIAKSHWVEFIDLKNYVEFYLNDNVQMTDQNYRNIFAEMLTKSELQKTLFCHLFDSKRIIFLVDGYDEISPMFSNFVLNCIEAIRDSGNFLMVTTRQYLSDDLTKKLVVDYISLMSFAETDQEKFLLKFWSKKSSDDIETLNRKSKLLLQKFHASLGSKSLDFFGNPLMMRMLSEIYSKHNTSQPREAIHLNVYLLFKEFWQMKIGNLLKKGPVAKFALKEGLSKLNILGIHHRLAIETYFNKPDITSLHLPDLIQPFDKTLEMIQSFGIIKYRNVDNKYIIEWTHRLFEEYFVADFVSENITKENIVAESEALVSIFLEVLFDKKSGEIRRIINDKLEITNLALSKRFQSRFFHKVKRNLLYLLIPEGHTAFISFVLQALSMKEVFEILILASSDICQPGNFTKIYSVIAKFLDKKSLRKLLLSNNIFRNANLVSAVLIYGNEFDFENILTMILKLFTTQEVKQLLTGDYEGFNKVILHSALKLSNSETISWFWKKIGQIFPNEQDQKDILMAKGNHNERILCEGIVDASKEGIIFVLNLMQKFLSRSNIKNRLIDGHDDPSNPSFSLYVVAEKKSFEIFNEVWHFMETSLLPSQRKKIFLMRTKNKHNILNGCIKNVDSRIIKRVFDIARIFLTKNEFKKFLIPGTKDESFLHSREVRIAQFRLISKVFIEAFDVNELKLHFLGTHGSFERYLSAVSEIEDVRKFNLVLGIFKTCLADHQLLSLFGAGIKQCLAVLGMDDSSISNETLFSALNARYYFHENGRKKFRLTESNAIVLHIILRIGSLEIISKTIALIENKLSNSQIEKLLLKSDCYGYHALARSILNNDKCVVHKLWPLYNKVLSKIMLKSFLLGALPILVNRKEDLKVDIFHLAAVVDNPFLVILLEFLKANFSQPDFVAVLNPYCFTSLTFFVAKFCSLSNMTEYLNFITDMFDNEGLKLIILRKMPEWRTILFFLLENESIECFRLFWSKISQLLSTPELENLIFENESCLQFKYLLYEANIESIEELKINLSNIFDEKKLCERFE